ncbi:MAG: heavy metal-binding domain-containing protein, partial [Pseudomonadales bacterium]
MSNSTKKTLGIALATALITAVVTYFLTIQVRSDYENLSDRNEAEITDPSAMSDDREPLYWVAPMDPNYQRDEPGKSPMGMDLIPVYADEVGDKDEGVGTVRISPDVVNNLGVRTGIA